MQCQNVLANTSPTKMTATIFSYKVECHNCYFLKLNRSKMENKLLTDMNSVKKYINLQIWQKNYRKKWPYSGIVLWQCVGIVCYEQKSGLVNEVLSFF